MRNCKCQNQFELKRKAFFLLLIVMFLFTGSPDVYAHCDRENGPVAVSAKDALRTGDFDKIVIWVGEDQEEELREKFQQSVEVFQHGGKSAQLAEKYFMESAVRLHRAAEGMPFEGLKPAGPNPPDIESAEKALETGDFEPVKVLLCQKLEEEALKWFRETRSKAENKSESVAAGRAWVDHYVKYITYIHSLYQAIEAGPPHGVDVH